MALGGRRDRALLRDAIQVEGYRPQALRARADSFARDAARLRALGDAAIGERYDWVARGLRRAADLYGSSSARAGR